MISKSLAAAGIETRKAEITEGTAGCEYTAIAFAEPERVKLITAETEELHPLGRIFDIDVIKPDGTKVSRTDLGASGRACILCGKPAFICGRSRAHSTEEVLEKQIEWALEFDLPLILHCRKAYPELISVLSAYKRTTLYGIFHSFTGGDGDSIFLPELLDFSSFMLGINGVVTFKKSVLPELLQNNIPLGRVVLETDSPYLSPVPYRGKRNESAYVAKVAEKLSEIYGEAPEKIVQTTLQNALKIFRKVKMYF